MYLNLLIVIINTYLCINYLHAQSKVEQSDDGNSGTISFSTPDLSDDDAHSPWVPDQMKCDACRAVSFQVGTKLNKLILCVCLSV